MESSENVLVIINIKICLLYSNIVPWTLGLQGTTHPWHHGACSLAGEKERAKIMSGHYCTIKMCRLSGVYSRGPSKGSWSHHYRA